MPRHWSRRLLSRAITLPLSFLLSLPLGAPVLAEPGAHDLIRPVAAQMDGVGEAIQFEELRQDWLKGMPVRPERLDNADVVFIKRGWVDPESPEWDPSILFLLHGDYEAYQNTRDHRPRLRLALFDEEAKSPEEAKALFAAAEQRRREFAKSKRLPTRFFDLPDVDSFYLFGRRSQQSLDQAAARPKAETTAPAQPPGEPLDADQRARRVYPVHRGDDHAAGDGRAHTPRRTESPVDPLMGIRMGRRTAVALLATGVLWSALLGQPKPVPAQTAGTTFTVQPGERSGERIQAALNQAQPGDTVHLLSHEGRPTEFLLEPFEQLRVPPGVRFVGHGHRLSLAVIGRETLAYDSVESLAERLAYDVSLFDQQGCVSPHVVYVERGGTIAPQEFAESLAQAMAAFERDMPRGRLSVEETLAIQQARTEAELRELREEPVRLFASPGRTAWTVIYEDDPAFVPSCLNRVVRVKPLLDLGELPNLLRPVSRHLQTVGAALSRERRDRLADALAPLGVCRVCPIGEMPHPPLHWHHDGGFNLLPLLKWTAIEDPAEG